MNNNKYAAIYCRVSTNNNGFDLQNQIEQCMNEAQKLGYIVKSEHIFQDIGTSRASMDERPGLMRLLKAVNDFGNKEGESMGAVIVLNLERLTRYKGEYLILKDFFGKFSAKIVSINNKDIEAMENEIKDDFVDFIVSELLK